MMKLQVTTNALLLLSISLLAVYFGIGIFFDLALVLYIKPCIIPSFMLYVVAKHFDKLTLNYLLFVLFFYCNEVLLLYYENSVHLFRAAMIASFFCYLALVTLGYNSIKARKIYTFPKGYTLFIFIINAAFLLAILYILTSAIGDIYLDIIIICNALLTIFLSATAVLYLAKFANKKAYYYFFGSFALIFNDVFAAIGTYFIDHVVLNTFDRVLHYTSFYLIYLFVVKDKKKAKNLITDL